MNPIIKKVIQFAVVTPNTDETVTVICETLNLGPLKVWDFKHPAIFDTTIKGNSKLWTMKLAFGWLGNMQFEVIQPTEGPSLYKEYLDKWKRAGLQHLLIDRGETSYPKMKELLGSAGATITNEAKTNVAIKLGPFILPPLPMFLAKSMSTVFGYTSTLDTLKMVIETSQYPPGVKPRQGVRMGVPTYWSAGEKSNFEELPTNSLITDVNGFIVLVKNLNEIKPHYIKLFGDPKFSTANELLFQLADNFVRVVQPNAGSPYEKVLHERGEGLQIIEAKPRSLDSERNNEVFSQKGFESLAISLTETLFTHSKLPFQVQIKL